MGSAAPPRLQARPAAAAEWGRAPANLGAGAAHGGQVSSARLPCRSPTKAIHGGGKVAGGTRRAPPPPAPGGACGGRGSSGQCGQPGRGSLGPRRPACSAQPRCSLPSQPLAPSSLLLRRRRRLLRPPRLPSPPRRGSPAARDFIRGSLWGSRMLQFSTVLTLLLLFSLWYLAKQEVIPFVPSCHWHNYNMNGSVFAAISQAGRKQLANRSFMPPLSVLFGTIILTEKDA
ncbi:collagen alpha-1(I) chain-like [Corvus cornix cornix]|uniref:collagen alpha-1(I) chain-like n=1 Tax=Corvus cornix cornix TaxID=932674 RepID=UPI00194FC94C|nr:collagen alpha-1(I) chain-like [Corvus cornix cornix]